MSTASQNKLSFTLIVLQLPYDVRSDNDFDNNKMVIVFSVAIFQSTKFTLQF